MTSDKQEYIRMILLLFICIVILSTIVYIPTQIFSDIQPEPTIIEDKNNTISNVSFDSDGFHINYTNPESIEEVRITPYNRTRTSEDPKYNISHIDVQRDWRGEYKLTIIEKNKTKHKVIIKQTW